MESKKQAKETREPENSAVSSPPSLSSAVLRPIDENFRRNMQDLNGLRGMPEIMAGFIGIVETFLHTAVRRVVVATSKHTKQEEVSPAEILFREFEQLVTNLRAPEFDHEEFHNRTAAKLKSLCNSAHYGAILTSAVKVARRTVVSGAWTAFECVAVDTWTAVLNENAIPLGHLSLGALPKGMDEGISSKHISVGLAAKHGFDLRHCLGTLLRSKFDFTSVDGIIVAYLAAFKGSEDITELQTILGEPQLRNLEATRNLIVHRAGIVDEQYNRQLSIELPLGQPLELTDVQITEYIETASIASAAILLFVNDWIKNSESAMS